MKPEYFLIPALIIILINAAWSGPDPSQQLMDLDMTAEGAYGRVIKLLDSGASPNAYLKGGDRAIFHAVNLKQVRSP